MDLRHIISTRKLDGFAVGQISNTSCLYIYVNQPTQFSNSLSNIVFLSTTPSALLTLVHQTYELVQVVFELMTFCCKVLQGGNLQQQDVVTFNK